MNEVCDMKFSGGNLDPTVRRYPASLQLPMHSHTQGRLCFVIRGNFQETIGPRNYERQRGAVLFRPAGLNHSEQFGRNESTCGLLTPTSKWLELTDEFGFLQQNDRTAVGGVLFKNSRRYPIDIGSRDQLPAVARLAGMKRLRFRSSLDGDSIKAHAAYGRNGSKRLFFSGKIK